MGMMRLAIGVHLQEHRRSVDIVKALMWSCGEHCCHDEEKKTTLVWSCEEEETKGTR